MISALLSLLSPLLGILGSLLPSIVRIFERKQEIQYEIELTKLKMDAATLQSTANIDIEALKAIASEGQSVRDHDSKLDGGPVLNALRSSIRPVVTYVFFIVFILVKLVALGVMISQSLPVPEILDAIWDAETMSLFSTILAFWFGSRIMEKRDQMTKQLISDTQKVTSTKK